MSAATGRVMRGLLAIVALCWLAPPAQAKDDFQSWNTVDVSKTLTPSVSLFFTPQIRIRHDASQLAYHEYRQGIRWKASKHLQIGLNYLFVRNSSSGKPREEHAGELDVTPKTTLGPVEASLRWRLAMRAIQGSAGEQEWQIRFMPKLAFPTQVAGHAVTPYVADDLFYDYTRAAWNQNRVFLGVTVPLKSWAHTKVGADVYYMLQSQLGTRHDWSSAHILGTTLSVQF